MSSPSPALEDCLFKSRRCEYDNQPSDSEAEDGDDGSDCGDNPSGFVSQSDIVDEDWTPDGTLPSNTQFAYVHSPHSCRYCSRIVIRDDRLPLNALSSGGRCILRLPIKEQETQKLGKTCPWFNFLSHAWKLSVPRPHRFSKYTAMASYVDVQGVDGRPISTRSRQDLFIGVRDGEIAFLYRYPKFLDRLKSRLQFRSFAGKSSSWSKHKCL